MTADDYVRRNFDDLGPGAEVVEASQLIDKAVDAASKFEPGHSRDCKRVASDQAVSKVIGYLL